MVTTNRKDIAARVKSLRNHGSTGPPPGISDVTKPYIMATFDVLGYNLRLSDIQAAVGVAQLKKLSRLLEERSLLADSYSRLLRDIDAITLPKAPNGCGHTYQSFVIRLNAGGVIKRNQIMDFLYSNNIHTRPGTHAVHRLGYYASKYRIKSDSFPNACNAEDNTITLPLFPGMTREDQVFVKDKIIEATERR